MGCSRYGTSPPDAAEAVGHLRRIPVRSRGAVGLLGVVVGVGRSSRARVRLSAAQLPTVAFESRSSDLYWGFRGTQGLTVTGSGRRETGRYTGTLSYVIRDSYGFPVGDTLGGFGPPMRYLQTACGAPLHAGGARWFPDTITVTVPFSQPA